MRTMKHLTMAAAAAAALALAGCGGGGGGTPPAPPKPKAVSLTGVTAGYVTTAGEFTIAAGETMDHGDITFSCPAGGADCDVAVTVASDGMATAKSAGGLATAANSADYDARIAASDRSGRIINLYAAASKATMDAEDAGKAAADALTKAEKYDGLLGVIATMGESKTAMDNAQAVLDARAEAGAAVTAAEAALADAKAAETAAMALSDGDDKTALLATIEDAIDEAEAQVAAAKAIKDGAKLKTAVRMVTGTGKKEKTANDAAKEVAALINAAFMSADSDNDNRPDRVPAVATTSTAASATVSKAVSKTSAAGETWAEIVGAASLMDMTIASNATTTKSVKVVSIAGMSASSVFRGITVTDAMKTEGTQSFTAQDRSDPSNIVWGTNYLGINGTVICGGADCAVSSGGDLTGSWYFTPTHATAYYSPNADGTGYDPETYVTFGHWLSVASATDSTTTVRTFARGVAEGAASGTANAGIGDPAKTGEYKGTAAGMSVHRTYDANDQVTKTDSGEFTADVTLTARFGNTSPSLSGSVENFVGDAVDPAWKVELGGTSDGSSAVFNGGTATGVTYDDTGRDVEGNNGAWTATAYGGADGPPVKRPVGIYGGFNANFSDGAVAGAYATRR